MKAIGVRYGNIHHNGITLNIEIEYYKTVAKVYIYDKRKAIPFLDMIRVKRPGTTPELVAWEYAKKNKLFK